MGPALGEHVTVTVQPGDVLYVPAGWFYELIYAPGQHMAVSFLFRPPFWEGTYEAERKSVRELQRKLGMLDGDSDMTGDEL